MARVDFSLYLVTDRHQAGGRPLQEVVSAAL
ncbi:MAG: thiamine phosphate synthase, partial [Nitrospirae bacterium]